MISNIETTVDSNIKVKMPQDPQYQGAPESALSTTVSELVNGTAMLSVDESAVDSSVPNDYGSLDLNGNGANTNPKRLYISNVSYQTTEDELKDLLTGYEIVSVLIPSQTVRGFKSVQQKSLGIAYVEFTNEADAELAKKDLSGKIVNDRALRVKTFVPYSPKNTVLKRTRSRRSAFHRKSKPEKPSTDKINEVDEEVVEDDGKKVDTPEKAEKSAVASEESNKENPSSNSGSGISVDTDSEKVKVNVDGDSKEQKPETSKDTVFISRLSPKATDGDLREFFHEYGPTDVYIFKNRINKKQHTLRFHQRYVSALVTLSVEDGVAKAIETLDDKKIKNKVVGIRAAYVSKIEDVKKAALVRQKKQAKLDQEANAAAAAAATSTTPNSELPVEETHEDSIDVVQDDDDDESVGFKIDNNKPQPESVTV